MIFHVEYATFRRLQSISHNLPDRTCEVDRLEKTMSGRMCLLGKFQDSTDHQKVSTQHDPYLLGSSLGFRDCLGMLVLAFMSVITKQPPRTSVNSVGATATLHNSHHQHGYRSAGRRLWTILHQKHIRATNCRRLYQRPRETACNADSRNAFPHARIEQAGAQPHHPRMWQPS
jgi:hypothetical protein